ncbi:LysR substrate-binding domain-containing protein [Amorphus orientalis]|uniref:LysR family hydrogen peroxide-inducible transcriptional activator n=1 Tax=Amorphus orientalis TaxID=649198 RepID=A0AAE3VLQ9_9HYPH|nr:LysR substrate-binding domain-containing protein [Amorphus orientalis]MDQ0314318.1 LysR family hydrogen peroxide-inducible transcriptional activator [Amorphus orientalis]
MTLRELEYLLALARYRHFGRAAEACHISQPTLSTQIKKLELELGTALVERSTSGVILTSVGEATVESARRILAEVQSIRDTALQARDPESGTVRLGIFPTLGPYFLPSVMLRFAERFPALRLSLVEEQSSHLISHLRDGDIDVALLALPLQDDQLIASFLFEEPFLLAVPPVHPLAERSSIALDEIRDQELLLLEDGHCLRDQALDICEMSGAVEQSAFRAASLETLRHIVGAGLGVTLLPKLATHRRTAGPDTVRLIPFENPVPNRRIALVWRQSSARAPLFGAMADLFRNVAAELLAEATPDPTVTDHPARADTEARRKAG